MYACLQCVCVHKSEDLNSTLSLLSCLTSKSPPVSSEAMCPQPQITWGWIQGSWDQERHFLSCMKKDRRLQMQTEEKHKQRRGVNGGETVELDYKPPHKKPCGVEVQTVL